MAATLRIKIDKVGSKDSSPKAEKAFCRHCSSYINAQTLALTLASCSGLGVNLAIVQTAVFETNGSDFENFS